MRFILLVIIMIVVAGTAAADAVTAHWSAPTTGSPVVEYVLELYESDALVLTTTTPDTFYTFSEDEMNVPFGTYVARVAGRDIQDRQGPWSPWSPPYILDVGQPGAPQNLILLYE